MSGIKMAISITRPRMDKVVMMWIGQEKGRTPNRRRFTALRACGIVRSSTNRQQRGKNTAWLYKSCLGCDDSGESVHLRGNESGAPLATQKSGWRIEPSSPGRPEANMCCSQAAARTRHELWTGDTHGEKKRSANDWGGCSCSRRLHSEARAYRRRWGSQTVRRSCTAWSWGWCWCW